MSGPRKIWTNVAVESNGAGLCGEWNHCDVGSTEDTLYHRDDAVWELVEALKRIGWHELTDREARDVARAALAKIAQEE